MYYVSSETELSQLDMHRAVQVGRDHLCAFSAEEIDTNSKLNWMLCINNIQHTMQRVQVVAKQVGLTVRGCIASESVVIGGMEKDTL